MNSIFEILSFACVMCQNDPSLIEEYKNPFLEFSRNNLFVQNTPVQTDSNPDSNSIYFQLLLYWTFILNDPKNSKLIYLSYSHALNTIKSIFLSSVEWKRNLEQNVIGFLSLPWLANEKTGYDLEFHKDNGYKQCSLNLIQNSDKLYLNKRLSII